MGRKTAPEEDALAQEVYERDRVRRPLKVVPPIRGSFTDRGRYRPHHQRGGRSQEEQEWAAQSGPVRVRKGDA